MKQKLLSVLTIILICFLLFWGSFASLQQDRLLRPITEEILRFRVLAASNSPEDQANKLAVRDAVLSVLEKMLPAEANRAQMTESIADHTPELLAAAQRTLPKDTPVSLKLCDSYFPRKTYGSLTFPAGTYEALLIRIGEAEGENWWCCLYPQLCFTDAITAVVTEESEQDLKNVLTEEEFSLLESKPQGRFWLLDWLEEHLTS